ncbi:hypothetical protein LWI28_027335 [Acer negundo]|uniref:RNase H type-1 domain-containing protein n=1 Tax=Acer negundo TaxID=4023 RepID=A0AAD5JUJ6_ACENE|nr:hypothetical protein LWI28_027335 [Acer negundo]
MDWWEVKCCPNKSLTDWFDGWHELCPASKNSRVWSSIFSSYIGTHDSNTAELFAIHRACTLCVSSPEIARKDIVVVSDISTASVSWINEKGIGSINHVETIHDIRSMLLSFQNMSVVYCTRAQNSFADTLAKKASNRRVTCLNGVCSNESGCFLCFSVPFVSPALVFAFCWAFCCLSLYLVGSFLAGAVLALFALCLVVSVSSLELSVLFKR